MLVDDIIFYIPVYNDIKAVTKCIRSINSMGFPVLVGDGRFHDFPIINNSEKSTDGLYELDFVGKIFHHGPCYEEEKLTKAFEIAHDSGYKFVILLGADEYLEGSPVDFLTDFNAKYDESKNPQILNIYLEEKNILEPYAQNQSWYPKIYCGIDKLEGKNLHWKTYNKETGEEVNGSKIKIVGMNTVHDSSVRTDTRNIIMKEYQDQNVVREQNILRNMKRERNDNKK